MRALFAIILLGATLVSGAEVPRPSPDFTITFPDGKSTSILRHKGKVLAVEFMVTTCRNCQHAAQVLSDLYKELGPRGFQPLGITVNPNPHIPQFISTFKVNYPVGSGSHEGAYSYLQESLMAPSLHTPEIVFIDRQGVIRGQYNGMDKFILENGEKNIRAIIMKLLQEPAGKKTVNSHSTTKRTS